MAAKTSTIPIDAEKLRSLTDRIFASWRNAPESVIVDDFFRLPPEIQAKAKDQGQNANNIKGVYHRGTVYLVRSNIKSEMNAETAIFHEIYGHFGLRQLFDQEFNRKVFSLYSTIGGSKGIALSGAKMNR